MSNVCFYSLSEFLQTFLILILECFYNLTEIYLTIYIFPLFQIRAKHEFVYCKHFLLYLINYQSTRFYMTHVHFTTQIHLSSPHLISIFSLATNQYLGSISNQMYLVYFCVSYQAYQLVIFTRHTLLPGKGAGPNGATIAVCTYFALFW